jgi:hypothetical protein
MYYIRDNKANVIPTRIVFYDCESYINDKKSYEEHVFRLATYRYYRLENGAYRLAEEKTVYTPSELWGSIAAKAKNKVNLWVIAHNQHYDFFVSNGLNELRRLGYDLETFSFENNLFYARLRNGTGSKITVVDSMNYFKTSIEEMGKRLGLPKLKVDFKNANDSELQVYNKRDVEILAEFFIKFLYWWRNNDLGKFGISIPQCALHAYRHKFMKTKILVHRDPAALELESRGYFGGRCECFYVGAVEGRKIYYLDVNSMYPFVMKNHKYPRRLLGIIENPSLNYLRKLTRTHCVVCETELDTPENAYPLKLNKLIFPVGRFTTVLNTPELQYALYNNHVVKANKCAVYEAAQLFNDYVEYFYRLKQDAEKSGDALTRGFAKLMLNSLYGKFGQQTKNYEPFDYPALKEWGSELAIDASTGKVYKILFIDGRPYRRIDRAKLAAYTFIAIAAHVTSYARMVLWYMIKSAGIENVYYCDTDSIFVNEEGYDRVKQYVGDALGALKIEGVYDQAVFMAPKMYVLGDMKKHKGLTKNARPLAPNEYEDIKFYRALTLLSKGIYDRVIVEKIIKRFTTTYDKGAVNPDGRVRPWHIPQDLPRMTELGLVRDGQQ